ncbi:MAG: radical SAM protein, partial [Candidatus Nanoarchaeia archaeon]
MNDVCNMHCDHCYLQLENISGNWVKDDILTKILNSNFKHIAIVGKEPLFSKDHIDRLAQLLNKIKNYNRTTSVITNGKNLGLVDTNLLENLDFIDISFDGGKETYSKFRMGNFKELKKQIQIIYSSG